MKKKDRSRRQTADGAADQPDAEYRDPHAAEPIRRTDRALT